MSRYSGIDIWALQPPFSFGRGSAGVIEMGSARSGGLADLAAVCAWLCRSKSRKTRGPTPGRLVRWPCPFWHKTDMRADRLNVRYRGQSGHDANEPLCPPMAHSERTVVLPSRSEHKGSAEADLLTRNNAKCFSYLATSHHLAGASTAQRTIGIHMNQAAPAYSPLTTL